MHTIGVIAEYNPFHSGHGHHLRMLSPDLRTGLRGGLRHERQLGTAGRRRLGGQVDLAELALSRGRPDSGASHPLGCLPLRNPLPGAEWRF